VWGDGCVALLPTRRPIGCMPKLVLITNSHTFFKPVLVMNIVLVFMYFLALIEALLLAYPLSVLILFVEMPNEVVRLRINSETMKI
jgi:hypothetical protein